MHTPSNTPPAAPRDQGASLIITMLVMVVAMVLGTTLLSVTVNNLGAARRSQDAASALDAADAGVTQAVTYLRRNGGRGLRCAPSCTGNPWGNQANPTRVELPGTTDQRYRTWIEPLPTAADPAFYRVHSTGYSAEGVRAVQVDVELALLSIKLPLGVFARTVSGGGTADVQNENVYTTGCVYNRSKIDVDGVDPVTGLPAAVHSTRVITDANGNNATCSVDSKAIHKSSTCDPAYPHDHDSIGGAWPTGSPCRNGLTQAQFDKYYRARDLNGDGSIDVNGSYVRDAATLRELFDIDDDPLQAAELETLKEVAKQQGTYFTTPAITKQSTEANAVMYFDFTANPGGVVDLKDITTHRRADTTPLTATDPRCKQESLLIVIEQGNARFNSNPNLAASLVLASKAPYGEIIKANGTAGLIGTVFADKLNLVGTYESALDQCFISNLSPSIYDVSVSNYLEVDRAG